MQNNKIFDDLMQIGEPLAAGMMECPEKGRFYRVARAYRRYWEHMKMTEYRGSQLYPYKWEHENWNTTIYPMYAFTYGGHTKDIQKRLDEKGLGNHLEALDKEFIYPLWLEEHTIGGNGYTHSHPNYKRIIKEGFNSYIERIKKIEDEDLREGLLEVVEGVRIYRDRSLAILREGNAPERLIKAFERVPFEPARDLFEALVCWNFIFYIDGCDNPGRLDAELIEYHKGEDVTDLLHEIFENADRHSSWSSAIGPEYNALSIQVLKAAKGMRRPLFELRTTKDMPDEVWEAALDDIESGCQQPAFYNEELYQQALAERFPQIPKKDLMQFNGGGCTETMLAGMSKVGSLDAGINLGVVFDEYYKSALRNCKTFDEFYNGLMEEIYRTNKRVTDSLNRLYKHRMENIPQPVRTLLIDDCIDKGKDYNAGGARWSWSCINIAGTINVIDSLLAIKKLVYDDKKYSADSFIVQLGRENEELYSRLRECPHFGVDDDEADKLAADFCEKVFTSLDKYELVFGEGFVSSSIQFVTYTDAGDVTGATPDGRKNREPLCDSLGAIHGKDNKGPTALLNSVAKLALNKAVGTPILNFRIQKKDVKTALRPLISGFFAQGGMQIQVNCVSREEMEDALINPEKHENLIVRTGGYNEYFNNLSDLQKKTVMERTEHGV